MGDLTKNDILNALSDIIKKDKLTDEDKDFIFDVMKLINNKLDIL